MRTNHLFSFTLSKLAEIVQGFSAELTGVARKAELAAAGGSEGIGFVQEGAGAVPRSVEDELRERVSVKQFGAKGDGVTDDTAAIQAALNYLNAKGGGSLHLPAGRYRKADTSPYLTMYSNITISGDGDASDLFHDDRDSNPRMDLLVANNVSNIRFENFKISGTLATYTNETNQSQGLVGSGINGCVLSGMTFSGLRYMATAFSDVVDGQVIGCRFTDIQRDGARFTHSRNIRIIGNHFSRVADDAVALHSIDGRTSPVGSGFIVSGNTFEACQGVKILGAKVAKVVDNAFQRTIRAPILVASTSPLPEGNTPMFAIDISRNIIMDTFGDRGTNYCISVAVRTRSKAALTAQPGDTAPVFGYAYENDVDAAAKVNIGAFGIHINDNIIGWSLPRGVNYSSYGYGTILDRPGSPSAGFADPAITNASFACTGVLVTGPVRAVRIAGNTFTGGSANGVNHYPAVWLSAGNAAENHNVISTAIVERNIISDWVAPVAVLADHATTNGAMMLSLLDNVFNLDPFFRSADHAADNTWASDNALAAISLSSRIYSGVMRGNHFRNLSRVFLGGGGPMVIDANYVYFQPNGGIGLDGSATNRGVRYVPSSPTFTCIIIDGDPSSATFEAAVTVPRVTSSAMPTAGTYVYGHVIRACLPIISGTSPDKYAVSGWLRIRTGSEHVLNTDWVELRTPTGT